MSITILSPHSGNPVKIRDQDVGRAVTDKDGKLFYVLATPEGEYYAAFSRAGGPKDLERYRHMTSRHGFCNKVDDGGPPAENQYIRPAPTRRGMPGWLRLALILFFVADALVLAYFAHRLGYVKIPGLPPPSAPAQPMQHDPLWKTPASPPAP